MLTQKNKYISFISDEHLLWCIEQLYNTYETAKRNFSIDDFYKNKIDPFKLLFDMNFFGLTEDEIVANEIQRKIDKTISNAIGDFHENLIDGIKGYKRHPIGAGFDISDDESKFLFADIKNKHNTVKGDNLKDLYTKLESFIEGKEEAKSYWVQIISKGESFNTNWTIPKHNKNNENIIRITGDQFYYLLTKNENAFSELCLALPKAIKDFLMLKQVTPSTSNLNVYEELVKRSLENEVSFIIQLMNDTFPKYLGFPLKEDKNK